MSAFVGLDVHSEKTFATVLDQDGRVVARALLGIRYFLIEVSAIIYVIFHTYRITR